MAVKYQTDMFLQSQQTPLWRKLVLITIQTECEAAGAAMNDRNPLSETFIRKKNVFVDGVSLSAGKAPPRPLRLSAC